MTKWRFEFDGRAVDSLDPDAFDAALERVTAELDGLGVEPDIAASLTEGTFTLSVIVEADDLAAAATTGLAAIKSGLHGAGFETPEWPELKLELGDPDRVQRLPLAG
ncbi:MAG: hypothetical protein QOF21_1564 [Actinomycetota bacterium]